MKTLGVALISGTVGIGIGMFTLAYTLIDGFLIGDLTITDDKDKKTVDLYFNKGHHSNDIVKRVKNGNMPYAIVRMFVDNSIKDEYEEVEE